MSGEQNTGFGNQRKSIAQVAAAYRCRRSIGHGRLNCLRYVMFDRGYWGRS